MPPKTLTGDFFTTFINEKKNPDRQVFIINLK